MKDFTVVYMQNNEGPQLAYTDQSNVKILEMDGKKFKNYSGDGFLKKYEDWRLSPDERATDLAARLTIEEIAGLMLYSGHQAVPADLEWYQGTYGGKTFKDSGAAPDDLTDQQIDFLKESHLRHFLITKVQSPEVSAGWNNNLQRLAESLGAGVPVNISSDPRHSSDSSKEFNFGAGGKISMWPESLGLAATFDPEMARRFGEVASEEYRALGISTALSPQVDLATDPRWYRFSMTFGEDRNLSADMCRAYIDGFQTSRGEQEIADGWGYESVNAMVKHWPGGGTGESGRDAHFGYGKYAVYPGDNFDEHLYPFTEGAFKLDGPTTQASAIMPYYTISFNQDKNGENVGNSYSRYMIQELLREKYGFNGVVCTDWAITDDEGEDITKILPGGRCWGVEERLSVAERHLKLLMAGVDQFGGNNDINPLLEAYEIGARRYSYEWMRQRFEQSAVRLLKNIFRLGLFENPYLQPEQSAKIVGTAEKMALGYEAQIKSMVLLKNKNKILPIAGRKKVYIPSRCRLPWFDWMGNITPGVEDEPFHLNVIDKYFDVTKDPKEADFGLVFMETPVNTTGYSKKDVEEGGNGYIPISLQYRPYKAEHARKESIAGDAKDILNRSYYGKTASVINESDLDQLLETRRLLNGKPVLVSLLLTNPTVPKEFEWAADAIIANFGVQDQAIMDVISGIREPNGLLPFQMPSSMKTVEEQDEDVPRDMEVFQDEAGHSYDFGFGLNWSGVIKDARTQKYS